MLVERDGHLRFEAEVSLQGTVATLATDGAAFALLDAHKNTLSRGPACPANVASLIRIPLAPADVAAILLGDARLPDAGDGPALVGWEPRLGADVLAVRARDGGTLQLFFRATNAQAADGHSGDLARELVAATRAGPDGAPLWRTQYQDFETAAGQRLPRTILFAEHAASFDDGVEIHFKDRTLGGTPPPAAFTLEPPPGVVVRDVGCGAGP
jgi:hypothetical protein